VAGFAGVVLGVSGAGLGVGLVSLGVGLAGLGFAMVMLGLGLGLGLGGGGGRSLTITPGLGEGGGHLGVAGRCCFGAKLILRQQRWRLFLQSVTHHAMRERFGPAWRCPLLTIHLFGSRKILTIHPGMHADQCQREVVGDRGLHAAFVPMRDCAVATTASSMFGALPYPSAVQNAALRLEPPQPR
jgi:hypothetical protein